ncbi:ABC transporter substrate-binding protein [Clostridium sediminicola]|uniref:ABC transporter substrate-binding protein n=1 Tax=Clostridium sediminicola TaxID=3114879 RepID=UPI0031F25048
MKRILIVICSIVLCTQFLIGCADKKTEEKIENQDWDVILQLAEDTTVTFYGWGGDENINQWIDSVVAKELKEKYNINLKRIPMIPNEYIPKLLNEKQLDSEGTIDIVWINGENFYNAKVNDLLFGPFTEKLPNFNQYVNQDSTDILYDFGHRVDGFESPYGKAQMVFIGDTDKVEFLPKGHEELFQLAKKYPGKITYPDISDFTGSAFIRNVIYDLVGYEAFIDIQADKDIVKTAIKPAMEYLKDLKPYLWREGETYPATLAQLDNMYSDGEVFLTMNYSPFHIATKIQEGSFTESSKSFVFEKGTIGNTHFLAIPFNAPNKAAALVTINHILSPEIQVTKYDPKVWGDLPVTEFSSLTDTQKELFNNIKLGKGVISQEKLLDKRLPEMRAELVPIIEEIWREEILENE